MRVALLTLYENHYHFGVASLVNSAIKCGFNGPVFVGYRDILPPWAAGLRKIEENVYQVNEIILSFFQADPTRHFGYSKPFIALDIFATHTDIDCLVYADPDVVLLSPWTFFEKWFRQGVALVQDANFPEVHSNHPWREDWRKIGNYSEDRAFGQREYPNSGFIGVRRQDLQILEEWARVTECFERMGGCTSYFQMADRHLAVVGDQDLLAASLMGYDGPVSFLNGQAMGFQNYFFILSHAIETPKPWVGSFAYRSLRGNGPSGAAKQYLRFSNDPIKVQNDLQHGLRKLDLKVGTLISRIWRRS